MKKLVPILIILFTFNIFPQGVKFSISAADTVQGGVDNFLTVLNDNTSSLKAYFNLLFTGDVYSSDTIEVSTEPNFAHSLIIPPYILFPLPEYGTKNHTNLFIRRYAVTGATGIPSYLIRLWGY